MKKQYFVEKSALVNASAATVFNVLLRVDRWNQWTASIKEISILDNAPMEAGSKLRVLQPKLSPAVWIVTEVSQDKALVWEKRSSGLRMLSEHSIYKDANGSRVIIRMTYGGPMAGFAYLLSRGLTDRYMTMEINGLKAECEKGIPGAEPRG